MRDKLKFGVDFPERYYFFWWEITRDRWNTFHWWEKLRTRIFFHLILPKSVLRIVETEKDKHAK